jgi:hypothetical protein
MRRDWLHAERRTDWLLGIKKDERQAAVHRETLQERQARPGVL